MTRLSGWCSAPEGARPMCAGCKVLDCSCACHSAQIPVVEPDSASERPANEGDSRYTGASKSGPDQRELIEAHRPLVRSDRQ